MSIRDGSKRTVFDQGRVFSRRLDWNLLKSFHEIAMHGGVTRAAEELGRKQPAMSLSLRRLEDQLSVTLCQRGPRGFALTQEGEVVAEICDQLFGTVMRLPNRVADTSEVLRGKINIQVISNLVDTKLDASIERFHKSNPLVEIYVSVVTWEVVSRSLIRSEVDIGIAPAHHKKRRLNYRRLFTEYHRPYCGRGHHLYGRSFDAPGELADEAFSLPGADEPDELTQFRLRHRLGRYVAGLSEHLEEARRLTMLGLGVCFLPQEFAAPDVVDGRLHPLLPAFEECTNQIYAITNPDAPAFPARDRFVDELFSA